ncbi:MAG: hypothetical protein JNN11_02840 [Candidatus Doudnabacteria bacterium]|nr:hypothetical protein [Candidatus Doudnabacteria bacterium]
MPNNVERFGLPESVPSSLKGKSGEHKFHEKKGTIQTELLNRLRELFDKLPEHSKIVLAREIRLSGETPEEAIERIEREIQIRKEIVDHLKHSGDPKEALQEVRKIIPENKIQ